MTIFINWVFTNIYFQCKLNNFINKLTKPRKVGLNNPNKLSEYSLLYIVLPWTLYWYIYCFTHVLQQSMPTFI